MVKTRTLLFIFYPLTFLLLGNSLTSSSGTEFSENFDNGFKRAYASGIVSFESGNWLLDNALTGTLPADPKIGKHSIRIRNNGRLSMLFDFNGSGPIKVIYGFYGDDPPCEWQLWSSVDLGKHYKQVLATQQGSAHLPAFFNYHWNGQVRFEIRKVGQSNSRLEIESFTALTNRKKSSIHVPISANEELTEPTIRFQYSKSLQSGRLHNTEQKVKPLKTAVEYSYIPSATQGAIQDNNPLLPGNPSNAKRNGSANNYLIDHHYYIESYNRTRGEPNWVCWHLEQSDLGNTERLNDFRPDTSLPSGWYEVDNTSYKRSGFDRGHNCPSGDRTSSTEANSVTFLMDNIIPQAPNNNQHTWEHLEEYCRNQVRKGKEAYIIMGSYGNGGIGKYGYAKTIDRGLVAVPAHIWKVVILIPVGNNDLGRINENARIIAIDTPNINDISPNFMNYICTIHQIEMATGYQLLSRLPGPLRSKLIESRFKGGD